MADIDPIKPPGLVDLANERPFRLGKLEVRPAERVVTADGKQRELQPRVMQVLVALARVRPEVVSRDRLIEQCWGGRIVGDDALNRCVLALRHIAHDFTPPPFTIDTVPRIGHRLLEQGSKQALSRKVAAKRWWPVAAVGALGLLGATAFLASGSDIWPWHAANQQHTVLVTAGSKDEASRDLARDLNAKLGDLQLRRSGSIQPLGDIDATSHKPGFELDVARLPNTTVAEARLTLTDASKDAVIWSKELRQPSRSLGDLKQQIGVAAAHVLGCLEESLASPDPLSERILGLYLDACAQMADRDFQGADTAQSLIEVVNAAPRFADGWAKLLMAEADALNLVDTFETPAIEQRLRKHLVEARRINPQMPEAYVVEAMLLPLTDHLGRGRVLAAAVDRNPNNALVHSHYGSFLQDVGQLDAGVAQSRHAVRLDPLSPAVRDGYITALGVAGAPQAARAELREAERLWPGSISLLYSRYRHHLRWGDPREALRLMDSGSVMGLETKLHRPFLEARIDPSPAKVEKTIEQARKVFRDYPAAMDGYVQSLAEFDRKEEIFQVLLNAPPTVVQQVIGVLFRPAFSEVHHDPRFMRAANRIGLVNYWRATGKWPDFCYAPDLKYDCRSEASTVAR